MGRRPDLPAEEHRLRQATREAHEAIQGLNDAIKEARNLTAGLVSQYELLHETEMRQLSNHLQEQHNEAAIQLNDAVIAARAHILRLLTIAEMKADVDNGTIRISWPDGKFDENVPPPYPHLKAKDTSQ